MCAFLSPRAGVWQSGGCPSKGERRVGKERHSQLQGASGHKPQPDAELVGEEAAHWMGDPGSV